MKHVNFLLALCLLLSVRCTSERSSDVLELIPLEQTKEVSDLSPHIDSMQFIVLEEVPEQFLSYLKKMLIDRDGNIIVQDMSGTIGKYTADGKFLFQVGRKGRGPGEYFSLRDICISGDGRALMVYHLGGVSLFSLEDGHYIDLIELPRLDYDGICPGTGDQFYLMAAMPTGSPDDYEHDFNVLNLFSGEGGTPIKQLIPRKDYIMNVALFSQSFDGGYYLRPLEGENILYKINGDEVKPVCTISYGDKAVPPKFIYQNGQINMHNYIMSNYFKMTLYVHDTADQFFFTAMGPEGHAHNFVYSKEMNGGIRWCDAVRDSSPALIMASDATFLYVMLADVENYVDKNPTEMNPLTRCLVAKYNELQLAANDNPMIVKIKFRNI